MQCLAITVCLSLPAVAFADAQAEYVEREALKAVSEGSVKKLSKLAKHLRGLKPEQRRRIPVKVRGKVVEFRYDGEFAPMGLDGKYDPKAFSPGSFEYLIATKFKAYESFLTVQKPELARLQKLRAALKYWAKGRKTDRPNWRFKMIWTEDGTPRVEDLDDALKLIGKSSRDYFYQQLHINEFGLAAGNVNADPASFPTKRVKAAVLIEIRVK